MKREYLQGYGGYQISCCNQLAGEDKVLLICHGFGSSQQSPMVEALRAKMPSCGIGTYSFDFPAHGESPVDGSFLRIQNCIRDLQRVEDQVAALQPNSEIYYFGSSFGAYIALLYLAEGNGRGRKAFLRSAAVDMHGIVAGWFEESRPDWQRPNPDNPMEDYFLPDYDYGREMRITRGLLQDFADNNVFSIYPSPRAGLDIGMVHGSLDSTAPVEDALRFAKQAGAQFFSIPSGEHRLMGSGELERVLDLAKKFFLEKKL